MIRLREALPLAALVCASCSAFGSVIKEGGAAGGAAVGSLAGPGGAAAGAIIGGMAGDLAAEAATGTEALRVPIKRATDGGGAAPLIESKPMTLEFVIVGLVLAGAIRELWALKRRDAEQQKQLDELWDHLMEK